MAYTEYTDLERTEFLEVATEVGLTRAKRQLGYPASWATAKKWADAAGIEIPLDSIKAQAAAAWDWYKAEELLIVAKEALLRIVEALQDDSLTPDDQKKLSEAYQKYVNTILLLEGKATSITESRKTDTMDIGLMDLLNEEKARNHSIENEEITHASAKEVVEPNVS